MMFDALVGTRLMPEAGQKISGKSKSAAARQPGENGLEIDPDFKPQGKRNFREALETALNKSPDRGEKSSESAEADGDEAKHEGARPAFGLHNLVVVLASAAAARFETTDLQVPGRSNLGPELAADTEKDSGSRKNLPASAVTLRQEFVDEDAPEVAQKPPLDERTNPTVRQPAELAAPEPKDAKSVSVHGGEPGSGPADKRAAELLAKGIALTPPPTAELPKIVPRTAELARPMQNPTSAHAVRESVRLERTDNGGRAELKLDMGDGHKVELRVEVENGVARVMLTSRSHELHGWMHRSADQLMRALLDAGLQLDGVDVDTSGDHQHQQHRRGSERGEHEADSAVETVWLDALPSKIHIVA